MILDPTSPDQPGLTLADDGKTLRPMTPREKAEARFFTAASGEPPTASQRMAVKEIQDAAVALAEQIYTHVPQGPLRATSLTQLTQTQMLAVRGIFDRGASQLS